MRKLDARGSNMADENWERSVLEELARESLIERRRARRWGIVWKSLTFFLLFAVLVGTVVVVGSRERVCSDKCTALVEVRGELDAASRASAEQVISGLQAAFKSAGTKGVVVRINSPGGSPVQAGQIYSEMRRLRTVYPNTPLYAVVDEIAASGGYYVATGAEKIFVDKASSVGSSGAVMESFGFTGAIEKLGIERRVVTAGESKSFFDPFLPIDPKQREYVQGMLKDVHQQFIDAVKEGRGARLKDDPSVFTGLVWNGSRAIELGLADALGNLDYVAREVVKAEESVDFTPEENLVELAARKFGAVVGREVELRLRS